METVSRYLDGTYFDSTGGTWHLEDAAFKARYIRRMLARHPEIQPRSICEIGCGAGGILSELQRALPESRFTGYDISPQAHQLSAEREGDRCEFVLGDAFEDSRMFDLVMLIDVVEHVEDCFGFLRKAAVKGRYKLYHIPIETHASLVLRGANAWDSLGHLHLFTIETALKTVEHTCQRIIDWMLTDGVLEQRPKRWRTRLANRVRRPLAAISPKFTARLLGGYSILILAE